MSEIVIRGAEERDVDAVHAILMSAHVLRGSMRVPHSHRSSTAERLEPRPGTHQLVAEIDGEVAGFGELVWHPTEARQRHAGEINMLATRADLQGRGVGRALVEALVDLAFGWLRLERLGLVVFAGNEHAERLYASLGFEHEGTMRRLGWGDGAWIDAHVMARLREPG